MRIQITTNSLNTEYVNAFTNNDINQSLRNQTVILKQQISSGSAKIEYQNIVVSLIEDQQLIGVIYSS